MRNSSLGVVLLIAAGCGGPGVSSGDPDAAPRPDAMELRPEGTHHPYAIDGIALPTNNNEARILGLDIDGDGDVDNQLGSIIALLGANGADVNAELADQINRGELNHLVDLQATALDDATSVGMYVWKGANPMPAPCLDGTDTTCRQHLQGTGTFEVASADPGDAMIFGELAAGHYSGDRGFVILEVPLLLSDTAMVLQLIAAKSEVDVTVDSMTNGILAGAVTDSYIQSDVIPQLHVIFGDVVAQDCGGISPDCCTPDSNGDVAIGLFDADGDCMISLQELQENGLLDSLLAPDLDLRDQEGLQGSDGVNDSLSLGVGFTAVPASYDIPSGL